MKKILFLLLLPSCLWAQSNLRTKAQYVGVDTLQSNRAGTVYVNDTLNVVGYLQVNNIEARSGDMVAVRDTFRTTVTAGIGSATRTIDSTLSVFLPGHATEYGGIHARGLKLEGPLTVAGNATLNGSSNTITPSSDANGTFRVNNAGATKAYFVVDAFNNLINFASADLRMSAQTFLDASRNLSNIVNITASGTINFSSLTASRLVATDASKNLVSTITSADALASVSDETGTGAWVFANTPTLVTPNIGAATGTSVNLTGAGTFGGIVNNGSLSFAGGGGIFDADGETGATQWAGGGLGSGGNIILYGGSHATQASDIQFRSGTTTKLLWDNSDGQWEFEDDVAVTGSLSVTGAGTFGGNVSGYQDNATRNKWTIEQDGTGDALLWLLLTGVSGWSVGVDNSDADAFKIGKQEDFSSQNYLTIAAATGNVSLSGDLSITGDATVGDRLLQTKGADAASGSTVTLGDGNYFDITGTTAIDYITTTGWTAGSTVILQFDGSVTVNHNTGSVPANTAAILLAGAANFGATANDVLMLVYDGVTWREVSRTVI